MRYLTAYIITGILFTCFLILTEALTAMLRGFPWAESKEKPPKKTPKQAVIAYGVWILTWPLALFTWFRAMFLGISFLEYLEQARTRTIKKLAWTSVNGVVCLCCSTDKQIAITHFITRGDAPGCWTAYRLQAEKDQSIVFATSTSKVPFKIMGACTKDNVWIDLRLEASLKEQLDFLDKESKK